MLAFRGRMDLPVLWWTRAKNILTLYGKNKEMNIRITVEHDYQYYVVNQYAHVGYIASILVSFTVFSIFMAISFQPLSLF